jgi:ATP-dependent Lon protease
MGDVMKESAQAALTHTHAHAKELGIDEKRFRNSDFHIHVPAAATPKDGPSAGVTMSTALVSLLTGRPVRHNVAMTGEITLRGKVLPVGGIKGKVLAAYATHEIDTVVMPKQNEKDLADVPQHARDKLHFVLVDRVDEIAAVALMPPAEKRNKARARTAASREDT